MRTPVAVGVVGLGPWGNIIARNIDGLPQTELRWLCDLSSEAQKQTAYRYRHARLTSRFEDLLNDEFLDAVVLATPIGLHHRLACLALDAEKHVLLKTVMALGRDDADDLIRRAEQRDRRVMVADSVLLGPGVRMLKGLIEGGRLGEIYYATCVRHVQGGQQRNDDLLWDIGSDPVTTILHLLQDEPVEATAWGEAYLNEEALDVAACHLKFATGISAWLHLSAIAPESAARLTVVGSRSSAVLDDHLGDRRLTLFETSGDVICPRLSRDESARLQCEDFVRAIQFPRALRTATYKSARVVHVLSALQRSVRHGGTAETAGSHDRVGADITLSVPTT